MSLNAAASQASVSERSADHEAEAIDLLTEMARKREARAGECVLVRIEFVREGGGLIELLDFDPRATRPAFSVAPAFVAATASE